MTAAIPEPEITSVNRPYWEGLKQGQLMFARCRQCGNTWFPARPECPGCLQDDWAWTPSAGQGRLISWVVYQIAFHPAFRDRLPYNVALVAIDEGPRLIANIAAPHDALHADMRLRLDIAHIGAFALARFAPA